MTRILAAATLAAGLVLGAAGANAANSNVTPPDPTDNAGQMGHTHLRQQLQSQLSSAGYTDIKITPSSFFIQAKDKKGDPVAMVVGPDTFTEVTMMQANPSAAQSQNPNGASPNAQGSTSSSTAPSGQTPAK